MWDLMRSLRGDLEVQLWFLAQAFAQLQERRALGYSCRLQSVLHIKKKPQKTKKPQYGDSGGELERRLLPQLVPQRPVPLSSKWGRQWLLEMVEFP